MGSVSKRVPPLKKTKNFSKLGVYHTTTTLFFQGKQPLPQEKPTGFEKVDQPVFPLVSRQKSAAAEDFSAAAGRADDSLFSGDFAVSGIFFPNVIPIIAAAFATIPKGKCSSIAMTHFHSVNPLLSASFLMCFFSEISSPANVKTVPTPVIHVKGS